MANIWSIGTYSSICDPKIPKDVEDTDRQAVAELFERYMDEKYPSFDPEIVSTPDKDYYLPALKVLVRNQKGLFSPNRASEWVNGELIAECHHQGDLRMRVAIRIRRDIDEAFRKAMFEAAGLKYEPPEEEQEETQPEPYSFPHEGCDCGIYGSVNFDELKSYLVDTDDQILVTCHDLKPRGERILCIIEPGVDADTIVSRKGWRAGAAFVSEIVGETMDIEDASNLLSIAWHREIDLRRLYENR